MVIVDLFFFCMYCQKQCLSKSQLQMFNWKVYSLNIMLILLWFEPHWDVWKRTLLVLCTTNIVFLTYVYVIYNIFKLCWISIYILVLFLFGRVLEGTEVLPLMKNGTILCTKCKSCLPPNMGIDLAPFQLSLAWWLILVCGQHVLNCTWVFNL